MQKKGKIPRPACGRLSTQASFSRHTRHCKKMSPMDKEATKKIRKLTKNL